MREKIIDLIIECISELNEEWQKESLKSPDADTPLYGENGTLDSLELVMLLSEVEQALEDELGTEAVLASEKAMSMKNSPFRNVAALTEYCAELVSDGK